MLNPSQLEEFAKKVADVIPQGFGEMPEEGKKQVQGHLQRLLEKMDLVSREEFDIQKAVLSKTRSKLERLEKRLAELEESQNS